MNHDLKKKPLVYVCSPYAGDVRRNTAFAKLFSRFAALRGAIPLTPHLLYPQFLKDASPRERALGMEFGMELLGLCDELWVFPSGGLSAGMEKEIAYAKAACIPVRYFILTLEEVKPA